MRKRARPLLEDFPWREFTNGQNAFVACFCQSWRDPFLWKKFGHEGRGWVLPFQLDPEICQTLIPEFTKPPSGIVPRRIVYERDAQTKWIGNLISAASNDSLYASENVQLAIVRCFHESLMEFIVSFKPSCPYAPENEVRLLYWNPKEKIVESTKRYVSVPFRDDNGSWTHPFIGMDLPVIDPDRAELTPDDRAILMSHSSEERIFEPHNSLLS